MGFDAPSGPKETGSPEKHAKTRLKKRAKTGRAHSTTGGGSYCLEVGHLIVELDLHLHGPQRFDEMRLVGANETWATWFEDRFG